MVGREAWVEVERMAEGAQFWTRPLDTKVGGVDGTEWVMEGRRGAQRKILEVWEPSDSGKNAAYRQFGLLMLKLGGLELGPYE